MCKFLLQSDRNQRGFTLVEMMVALLIGLVIMAAVTGVFITHSRTYTVHDDISSMQQDLRSTMMLMPAEFRIAGCDPLQSGKPEIVRAERERFEFTADIGGDATHPNEADGKIDGAGEHIEYRFRPGFEQCSGGMRRTGAGVICRKVEPNEGGWAAARYQPMAGNIEKLEFNYILWDENNKRFTVPFKENESKTSITGNDVSKIRAVQISLLTRSDFEDPNYYSSGDMVFTAGSGAEWKLADMYAGDVLERERHHRRRMIITTVQLRNMGN